MIKNRIKEYRARYDMKQEDLARLVGVRRETIGNLEKGRYNPSLVHPERPKSSADSRQIRKSRRGPYFPSAVPGWRSAPVGSAIGTHIGPGALGIAYMERV